jgi:antitoxin component YwqK of YwqJK toxin-antitoxin module
MKILLSLLLLAGSTSYGQTSLTIYLDDAGKVVSKARKASSVWIITCSDTDTSWYTVESYYANQSPRSSGSYRANTFPVAWEKLPTADFRDAQKEDVHREFYPNGQLKFEGKFQNGLGQEKHVRWYENGTLLSDITLVDGKQVGLAYTYYENGQLQWQYTNEQGLPEGEWIEYDENGRKRSSMKMERGRIAGSRTLYDEQGNPLPNE